MRDPSLQRELTKLAIVDIACGQENRHDKNFFIGKGANGGCKVTGKIEAHGKDMRPGTKTPEQTPESVSKINPVNEKTAPKYSNK